MILILLFTVRKSLPKNLVISNNLSCSLSGEEFRKACLSGSPASGVLPGCSQSCTWDHCRLCLNSSEAGSTFRFTPWLTGYQDSISHELLDSGPQLLASCWLETTLSSLSHRPLWHGSLLHQARQTKTAIGSESQSPKLKHRNYVLSR